MVGYKCKLIATHIVLYARVCFAELSNVLYPQSSTAVVQRIHVYYTLTYSHLPLLGV